MMDMIGNKKRAKGLFVYITFICLFSFLSIYLYAAEEVSITMDSTNLEMGASTNLTVTLSEDVKVNEIGIEGLDKFDIVSTNQSTSTQIINGASSTTRQYNIVLMPKEIGEFTLKAVIDTGSAKVESNTLKVSVTQRNTDLDSETEDIFIKTTLSKDAAYFGEKIVLSYDLYTRYNIEDYGFTDVVSMDGVIVNDIPKEQLQSNMITINGNKYLKYEVKKSILTPTKAGVLQIPAYNFQVNVSTGDFFSRGQATYLQTDPLTISVEAIPIDNQPANFSGIIGSIESKASYDNTEVNYGDAVTLNILLTGNANLDVLKGLQIPTTNELAIYETDKGLDENIINDQYLASKEFEVILVPKTNGEISVEPISISYFNTTTKSYETIEIPGTQIQVNGDIALNPEKEEGNSERIIEPLVITQISYNTPAEDEFVIHIKKDTLKIVGSIVLFILFIVISIISYRRFFSKKDDMKPYKKRIKTAKTQESLYECFTEILEYKTGLHPLSHSSSQIIEKVENEDTKKQIKELIHYFEYEKYQNKLDLNILKERLLLLF